MREGGRVYCSRCGAVARAGAKFCSRCGAALRVRACSRCGAVVRAGARFCSRCGSQLEQAEPFPAESAADSPQRLSDSVAEAELAPSASEGSVSSVASVSPESQASVSSATPVAPVSEPRVAPAASPMGTGASAEAGSSPRVSVSPPVATPVGVGRRRWVWGVVLGIGFLVVVAIVLARVLGGFPKPLGDANPAISFNMEVNPNAPSQYPGSITINLSGEGNRPFRIHPPIGDANPAVSTKSPGSYWLMWQNFFIIDKNGLPKYTFSVNPSLDMMVQLSRNPSILPYPTIGPAPSLEEAKRFRKEASASVQAATRYAGMFLSSLFTSSAEIINTLLGPPTVRFVKHNLDTIVSDGKEQAEFSIKEPIRNPIDGSFITDPKLLTMAGMGVCEVGIADLGFRTDHNRAFTTFYPLESAGFPFEPFIMGRAFRMDPTLNSQLRQRIELYFFQQEDRWLKHAGMQTLMEILNRTANPVTISYPRRFDVVDQNVISAIAQGFIESGQQGQQHSGIRTTLDGRPATVFLIKYQQAKSGPDKTKNIIAILPETQDGTAQKLYLFVPVSNKQPATGQFLEITLPDQTSKLIEFGSKDASNLISSIREALANIVLRPTQDLHTLSTMTALMLTPTPKTFINISTPDVPILEGNENILYKVAVRIFREEMLEEYNEVVQKLERINKSLDPRSPDAVEVVIGVLRDKLTKIATSPNEDPYNRKRAEFLLKKLNSIDTPENRKFIARIATALYSMGEICVYNQDGESLAITLNRLKHISIRNAILLIALHDGLPTTSTTERGIRVDAGPEKVWTANTIEQGYLLLKFLTKGYVVDYIEKGKTVLDSTLVNRLKDLTQQARTSRTRMTEIRPSSKGSPKEEQEEEQE
jgi:hypothetical protein